MCGRAVLANPHAIAEWFDVEVPADFPARFNIAPTQPVPIIRTPGRLELLKWGIARDGRPPQINARVETLGRTIQKQRRCLVALDGFFEWRPAASPAERQPFVFRDRDGRPLGFAGVWSATTTKDGEVVENVALMTCPPQPPVDAVHDRMPLVIPRDAFARWIDPGADVSDLLRPTATTLVATPVSPFVNSPRNDDPRCLERWEVGPPAQGALF
jgi:putative SOS response-associated peptidase YedK